MLKAVEMLNTLLSEEIKLLADSVQENRICGGNCKGETK